MLIGTQYRCESDKRRDALIADATANGIDYLEVVDNWAKTSPDSPRQRTLLVHLFKQPTIAIDKSNVSISGGARVPVGVEWAYMYGSFPTGTLFPDEQAMLDALPDRDRVLVVRTTTAGDYSQYRLSLVRSSIDDRPPVSFDAKLSSVELFFKVECPSDFDCATTDTCPPAALTEPEIDYLAKDWNSFRRLMLERMSATMPDWRERHTADVGVMLVELLAYAADHLSYFQDAVATEAYLGTARTRVSVRRHARLLDYPIHDGSNARTWIAVTWRGAAGVVLPKSQTRFATRTPELAVVARKPGDAAAAVGAGAIVFESMEELVLDPGLNQIIFYTWGDDKCCLPKGATRATLDNTGDGLAALKAGMVIVIGEVLSPATTLPEDADATHRQAVRITKVTAATDPLFKEPDGTTPQRLLEIEWDEADALAFPLCLYTIAPDPKVHAKGRVKLDKDARVPIVIRIDRIDASGNATAFSWSSEGGVRGSYVSAAPTAGTYKDPVTGITATFTAKLEEGETFTFGPAAVAWGNIVLADHGTSLEETLPAVIADRTYRPRLARGPVTQAAAHDPTASAHAAMHSERREVGPVVTTEFPQEPSVLWNAVRDLLESSAFQRDFVVETESDGATWLRFGDGTLGDRPDPTPLAANGKPDPTKRPLARYRVGNGELGNVGAEAFAHVIFESAIGTGFDQIVRIRNPLAASGGTEPESIAEVKLYAPQAFRTQERAVTVDDYAMIAERHPDVLKAAATRRWTGSWYTVFLSIDRKNGKPIDDEFEARLRAFLERYRLAAQDVEIEAPSFVPLDVNFSVCVDPRYYRADVKRALLARFSSRDLADGTRGFFHPDNFTFGQPVYLSRIIAAAMEVPGVTWVDPSPGKSVFRRFWDAPSDVDLTKGRIEMARLEIARLDNDPSFPENGRLDFTMMGGM
ncbi:MAG TPA: putative baseplate assembly protein [Kofleriaceae bacterium]